MTEQNTGTGAQAEPIATPQVGDPAAQAAGEADQRPTQDPQSEPFSLDDARKLRSENRSLRERLKAAEDAKRAEDEAKLSEQERTAKRLADLERDLAERDRALAERTVLASAVDAASRLGFANPRLAYRLLDLSEVEFDGEGQPTNVDDLLKAILKGDPYLASSHARPSGSIDGGTRGTAGLTREQIDAMTPEQYEARREEVMAFLARQRK
jgi:hypothetical protein